MASPVSLGEGQLAPKRDDSTDRVTTSDPSSHPDPPNLTQQPRRLASRLTLPNGKDRDARGPSHPLPLSPSPSTPAVTPLDPLGTHIFLRTNSGNVNSSNSNNNNGNNSSESSLAFRLRGSRPDGTIPDDLAGWSVEGQTRSGLADLPKDRRTGKGTSFLSRLAMRSAFRKHDEAEECESDVGDSQTDITSFPATTSVTSEGGGYIPLHKQPPRYIRVKSFNTKTRHHHRLFLAQELLSSRPKPDEPSQSRMPAMAVGTKILKAGDAIWAAEFSVDGRYLAVGGRDNVVRVFAVLQTEEERRTEEEDATADSEAGSSKGKERLSAPVFRSKPIREFKAHTGEVLALSWSKNNFLLSTSMDKTVLLWHISREECLATFRHDDLVTSIAFHPTDDRFFLSGSLDARLRLWSIPDKKVEYSKSTNEFITAVAFSPDGKTAICGVLNGMCWFFETDGFKLQFRIHVRSSRGKNAKGSKITGIKTAALPVGLNQSDVKVLISSNDSRVRIYSLKTRMLEVKFKGLENQSSQIHARFSDDGAYVISGSEDRRAYIWSMNSLDAETKDRQPYEAFDAHPEVVTTALMAPIRTKELLSSSGDPIYDLCNPPPVLLRSLDEAAASRTTLESGPSTETRTAGCKNSMDRSTDKSTNRSTEKPAEKSGYAKRCEHPDGNIIVTTDRTGTIKVFRQDCAFKKRQQSQWDMSPMFSKVNDVRRSGSIVTRASGGSGQTSLNLNMAQAHHPSDRIMSWRQDVDEGRVNLNDTLLRNERSGSPRKVQSMASVRIPPPVHAGGVQRQAATMETPARLANPDGPTSSVQARMPAVANQKDGKDRIDRSQGPTMPPTPSFNFIRATEPDDTEKGDGSFWNLSRWGGGLSRLRYSMSASPSESRSDGFGSNPSNDGTAKLSDKISSRRSLGVGDVQRPTIARDENRRKSVGPGSAIPRSPETQHRVEAVPEWGERDGEKQREGSLMKKRTDSGVGRLSVESDEEEAEKEE